MMVCRIGSVVQSGCRAAISYTVVAVSTIWQTPDSQARSSTWSLSLSKAASSRLTRISTDCISGYSGTPRRFAGAGLAGKVLARRAGAARTLDFTGWQRPFADLQGDAVDFHAGQLVEHRLVQLGQIDTGVFG